MTDIVNDFHGVQRFTACIGRANVLTAGTGGTSPSVDEITPGEVGVVHGSKGVDVEFVQQDCFAVRSTCERLHGSHGPEVVEEHIGEGHHQVHVFGEWN